MASNNLKNIVLLGAGFTTRNMGVWALASGAFTAIWQAHPDAHINLLDYSESPETYEIDQRRGSVDVELLNIRFSKRFWTSNNIAMLLLMAFMIRIVPSQLFRNMICNHSFILRRIQNMDIAGSIAGGDSFSDIYGLKRLIYVTLPQILILLMGKPLILLPQTIGPFNTVFGKVLSRFVLRRAEIVFTRDLESLNEARDLMMGGAGRLSFCYDMGFALEPRIDEIRIPRWLGNLDPEIPIIGVNVSGLLFAGGYTGKNMFGLKSNYRETIRMLIEHYLKEYEVHVVLFPHVQGGKNSRESDVAACQEIFNNTEKRLKGRLHVLGAGYDHQEIKALIGYCDFFLGSRMHACIAALSQGIPAVGLAYSRKFSGVYESINVVELVVDLREHEMQGVIALADSFYQRSPEFRSRLKVKMREVKSRVISLFDDIALMLK